MATATALLHCPLAWIRSWGPPRTVPLLVACLMAGFLVACKSTQGGEKPYAAVELPGARPEVIHRAANEVFTAAGYKETLGNGEWFYDRQASAMTQFLYGTWFDSGGVVERIKVQLVMQAEGGYRLECRPYIVRDSHDRFFEDESKMTRLKSKPYQEMLDKVAKKVQAGE